MSKQSSVTSNWNSDLFPLAPKLLPVMLKQLCERKGYSILKAGLRSGKTALAHGILDAGDYKHVVVFSPSKEYSCSCYFDFCRGRDINFILGSSLLGGNKNSAKELYDLVGDDKVLVIIEDAMWMKDSYEIFEYFVDHDYPVLVLSSRGTEYDRDFRWSLLPAFSFSTWDMNKSVTLDSLRDAFNTDPVRAVRDYCAF